MAIKIQGTTIIDDSKNIYTETGFYSDVTNSAIRPKSSSGGSYLQRWTGSTWDTILYAGNGGISCNRSVSVANGYYYYGDGSQLSNLPIPPLPGQFYYDGSNTAIRAPGMVFGQIGTIGGNSWNNVFIGKQEYWPPGQPYYRNMLETVFLKCEGGLAINPNAPMPFGSTTTPVYIHQQSGGLSWSFSSRRNKTSIEDLNIDYKKLLNLRPISYEDLWIEHPEFDENTNRIKHNKVRIGLIAEEVYEEIPEVCEFGYHFLDNEELYDLDEYGNKTNRRREPKKGAVKQAVNVNYDRLSVLLVGLLKEMNNEIETLKEEVKSLKESLGTP